MSLTRTAIWNIERNLRAEISLEMLAEQCGVSKFHLSHAFGQVMGIPVMRYVRARRLTEAAKALLASRDDVLSVALAFGYGSHEAFTRAFASQLGLTPEALRRRGELAGISLTQAREPPVANVAQLKSARHVRAPASQFAGVCRRYAYDNVVGIPGQWGDFMARAHDIRDRKSPIPVAVSVVVNDDSFDYLSAWEVGTLPGKNSGWTTLSIAATDYAVYEHAGHVSTLNATYSVVWDTALSAEGLRFADEPCLERHNPTFDPRTGLGGVELWVPIRLR